mmetsp:Transcript_10985/g.31530  ORF Transcript_10985/g.31530 Transcript_10985/m.31530 type:complete len:231 (-) Transcript_10985:2220-2912(-)
MATTRILSNSNASNQLPFDSIRFRSDHGLLHVLVRAKFGICFRVGGGGSSRCGSRSDDIGRRDICGVGCRRQLSAWRTLACGGGGSRHVPSMRQHGVVHINIHRSCRVVVGHPCHHGIRCRRRRCCYRDSGDGRCSHHPCLTHRHDDGVGRCLVLLLQLVARVPDEANFRQLERAFVRHAALLAVAQLLVVLALGLHPFAQVAVARVVLRDHHVAVLLLELQELLESLIP